MYANGSFRALLIDKVEGGQVSHQVSTLGVDDLPEEEVLVKVDFSSLNYKDVLAICGHPGIIRRYPHVPGIDAVGTVAMSTNPAVPEKSKVLVTGFELGTSWWGGLSQYIRVPGEWVVPLPEHMSPEQGMSLGTAGLTAALCIDALIRNGIAPESGEILVSGATGGVGSISAAILSKLGYQVTALTRKSDQDSYLEMIGVSRVVSHEQLANESGRSLGKEEWAGAIDTLGGNALANILKRIRYGGSVASCGMASGTELTTTVFPFILRGVNLLGIDSVQCPLTKRRALWDKLASEWSVSCLGDITQFVELEGVVPAIKSFLAGERVGRTVVTVD